MIGIQKCLDVIDRIYGHGFEKEVPAQYVRSVIRFSVGQDQRTVDKYLGLLIEFGFLRTINHKTYRIQNDEIERVKELIQGNHTQKSGVKQTTSVYVDSGLIQWAKKSGHSPSALLEEKLEELT